MRPHFLIAALVACSSPVASVAASFDCKNAASPTERLICNDTELSKLDDELSLVYRRAKASVPDQAAFKAQTRAAWQWREANCRTKDCLLGWYANRRQVLSTMSKADSSAMPSGQSACLKEGENVSLTGSVSRETFPGPPNYESIAGGDAPETVWILTVAKARCVTEDSMEGGAPYEVVKAATRFQLVFTSGAEYAKYRGLVGAVVVATGEMVVAHTGHHHTEALVAVKTLQGPADPGLRDR